MKKLLLLLAVAAAGLSILADGPRSRIGLRWSSQPAFTEGRASTKVPEPDDGKWWPIGNSNGGWFSYSPFWTWEKGKHVQRQPFFTSEQAGKALSTWFKADVPVKAEDRGRVIVFSHENPEYDVLVRMNGKVVGEILRPGGALDLTDAVTFGATNRLEMFATRENVGVSEKETRYWGYQSNPYDEKMKYSGRSCPRGRIEIRAAASLEDVYLKPCAEKRSVTIATEIRSLADRPVKLKAEFLDDDDKVVKTFSAEVRAKKGVSAFEQTFDWPDVKFWETSRPAVYRVRVSLDDGADVYPEFVWGFRELVRKGREIWMNGHVQHFRGNYGCYLQLASTEDQCLGGIVLLKRLGFNLLYGTHSFQSVPEHAQPFLDTAARQGMALFLGGPNINDMGFGFSRDQEALKQYARYANYVMRKYRNSPAIIAFNVGVNTYCPAVNMRPERLGQFKDTTQSAQRIDAACAACRAVHPNAFYFSHADGSTGEISSNNLYLNFTPLQEREEWLAQWSKNGILPWYAAEWGQPYRGSYWHMYVNFIFTEWMSVYYGEEAYRTEPEKCMQYTLKMGQANTSWHGAEVPEMKLWDYPLFTKFVDLLNWRTLRSFRAYGMNGGLMNFNVGEAFGNPTGRHVPLMDYRSIPVPDGRPEWANPSYDIFQRGNHDFLGFIGGGDGEHADRTHAYYVGEEIRKDAVLIWDGFGERTVHVEWKAQFGGDPNWQRNLEGVAGRFSQTLKTGDIVKVPISFTVSQLPPETGGNPWSGNLCLYVTDPDTHEFLASDKFQFEIYPEHWLTKRRVDQNQRLPVFVWSPDGSVSNNTAAAFLREMGVGFKPLTAAAFTNLPARAALFVGQNMLDPQVWGLLNAERIAKGLRVVVMPQRAEVWQAIGFACEDAQSRKLWPTAAFGGANSASFDHWRGSPQGYGADFGHVMTAKGTRGPRGTHRHSICSLPLRIPETLGFEPLVVGEFDMNYAGLIRYFHGAGALTFCALDFAGRLRTDPGARDVARVMLDGVLNRGVPAHNRRVYADGELAERVLKDIRADFDPLPADDAAVETNSVVLVGRSKNLKWERVSALRENRACRFVILNEDALAEAAGLTLRPAEKFWHSYPEQRDLGREFGRHRTFTGLSRKHLRWRDAMETRRFAPPAKDVKWDVLCDGLFAVPRRANDGQDEVLFIQLDPYLLTDRYAEKVRADPKDWKSSCERNTVSLSEEHSREMISRILCNLGVRTGEALTKRLLTFSRAQPGFRNPNPWHILGPFAREGMTAEAALDWKPSDQAEEMAVDATFNPNPVFTLPQGGEPVNWRPSITPNPDGKVDTLCFRFTTDGENRFGAANSVTTDDGRGRPEVNYYVSDFESYGGGDGALSVKAKSGSLVVWLNGKEVFRAASVGKDGVKVPVRMTQGVNRIGVKHGCPEPLQRNAFYLQVSDDPAIVRELAAKESGAEPKAAQAAGAPVEDLYNMLYRKFDPYMYVYW